MKTEFKIFKTNWGYYTIEDLIKEYQKEHHLEVRNVVVLRRTEEGLVVGVVFEKHRNYFSSSKHAITAFASPEGSK